MRRAAAILVIVCAFGACSQKEQQAPTSKAASPGPPAATASGATTTAASSPGREQFLSRCTLCHGESGNGDTTVGASYPAANLADGIWKHGGTREAIVKTIHDGVPETPMVGFGEQMTPQEIFDVADYVMSLHK
jgi:cytochrome c oxidase cbb3-type subunit 3